MKKTISLLIIAISIALLISITSSLSRKQIQLPSYVSVNLSQATTQRFRYIYDVDGGMSDAHSDLAWQMQGGKSMVFVMWFATPSRLSLNLGERPEEQFEIESICIRNLLHEACKPASEYRNTIRPLHHIEFFNFKNDSLEIITGGHDPRIDLGQRLLSEASQARVLDAKVAFVIIAVFFVIVLSPVVIGGRTLLSRTASLLVAPAPFTVPGIIICGGLLFFFYYFSFWPHMGVPNMIGGPWAFADLHALIAASDCSRLGMDVYVSNPCDEWNRVHGYGSPWLYISYIGIEGEDLVSLAFIMNALFLIVGFVIVNPRNVMEGIVVCALMLSPAVLLGYERANVDLLLFVVLCLVGVLAAHSRTLVTQLVTTFVFACATILKIYPFFSFFALQVRNKRIDHMLWMTIVFVSMIGIWYYFHPSELGHIFATKPSPQGDLVFGGGGLFYLLLDSVEYGTALTIMTVISILLAYFLSRGISDLGELSNQDTNLYLIGISILAASFYLTTNYDYRCVYLLMCLPMLFKMRTLQSVNRQTHFIANSSIILAILIVWADFPVFLHFAASDYAEQIFSWILLTNMVSIGIAILRNDKGWISQTIFAFVK
jgi:hypothetical protein